MLRMRETTAPSYGFTIVELMVSLLILAILLAVGVPSFRDFILDSRMNSEANEFLTTLNFTRSEAVKRNARVSMCRSSNGEACATGAGDWAQGWIVFVDRETGGTIGTFDGDPETILRVHAALNTQSTLVATADAGSAAVANFVSYIPDGRSFAAAAQAGKFELRTAGGSAKGRCVTLALGRAQLVPPITCS